MFWDKWWQYLNFSTHNATEQPSTCYHGNTSIVSSSHPRSVFVWNEWWIMKVQVFKVLSLCRYMSMGCLMLLLLLTGGEASGVLCGEPSAPLRRCQPAIVYDNGCPGERQANNNVSSPTADLSTGHTVDQWNKTADGVITHSCSGVRDWLHYSFRGSP